MYDILKRNRSIIGVIHFPPLLGCKNFPGLEAAEKRALADLQAFETGGVDAIIIENNYDSPHFEIATPGSITCMAILGKAVREATNLPIGVSVLWNDYQSALSLAKLLNLQFIRVPVFVDTVETKYGIMKPAAKEVKEYQLLIDATDIKILTDIHVKHSKALSSYSLAESARMAVESGSNGLIITGSWTGDAPLIKDLQIARETVGNFPIYVGSGASTQNINELLNFATGAIVSTSLKEGKVDANEENIKKWSNPIGLEKVLDLVTATKRQTS